MFEEEQQLIREFSAGNHTAFEHIYEYYCDAIYANIRKTVLPSDAAEDILQDVFATLWDSRSKIDPRQSIGNWLFVVSYNKSVSYLRKKLRERIDFVPEISSVEIQEEPAPDEQCYIRQVAALEDAVKRLPPHKRKVFDLYHFENKNCDEIAEELNLSVSSVKFYLKQSKSFIHNYVGEHFTHLAEISLLLLILKIH